LGRRRRAAYAHRPRHSGLDSRRNPHQARSGVRAAAREAARAVAGLLDAAGPQPLPQRAAHLAGQAAEADPELLPPDGRARPRPDAAARRPGRPTRPEPPTVSVRVETLPEATRVHDPDHGVLAVGHDAFAAALTRPADTLRAVLARRPWVHPHRPRTPGHPHAARQRGHERDRRGEDGNPPCSGTRRSRRAPAPWIATKPAIS
jgi:hypothetical protein